MGLLFGCRNVFDPPWCATLWWLVERLGRGGWGIGVTTRNFRDPSVTRKTDLSKKDNGWRRFSIEWRRFTREFDM